ncbi:DUF4403 family protein [Spirosoma sp. SC4-14]|uniref:DUF4403 family protein n=1 Tax=Spirosoma sp. SC4-14 TaxID=3128900 RepID=UPI0030CBFC9E
MKSSEKNLLLLTLAMCLFFLQCQHVNTKPPKAEGFDPPIPPMRSYLAGPITFRLEELQKKINEELDPVLVGKGSKGQKKGGIVSFRVERSGPVQIQYENQQVKLSAPLQLWLTTPFSSDKTSPNKPFCAMHVNFQSPLRVTENWRMASKIKFVDYQWIQEPEIRLLGKDISLTNLAQKVLERHKSDIEQAIDSAIYKDLRLDKTVSPIWQDIQKPLRINKQYGLWLLPKPISVAASPITGNNEAITTHLRIAFETETELKPKQPVPTKVPLPQLQKRDTVSQVSELHIMSFIPYADINQMLARTLTKEPEKIALGMLTINGASIYGSQRDIVVKTTVSGLIDGIIYLRGRPVFDTLTNTLSIHNLDFDAATDDALSKLSGSIVHRGLQKLLQSLLTISLGDEINQLPQKINEAFEKGPGKKTDLGIQSFHFVPQKIAVRPDGIQALIKVNSKVSVQVQKL